MMNLGKRRQSYFRKGFKANVSVDEADIAKVDRDKCMEAFDAVDGSGRGYVKKKVQ